MRPLEATFRNVSRLHVWMCLSALALLAVTVWMIAAEYGRPWRRYQREYRVLVELRGETEQECKLLAIEQIWLPDLTLDYHFRRVARFDRCTTCHQGIAQTDRGFPRPFSVHPRLDLFLGATSPHPVDQFGCTVCHDGQGSATSFRWTSHTPNTADAMAGWRRDHDWRPNRDWEWPMLPRRFVESRCLQCHHEVTDLEPSNRYLDPPAPKLLAGYHLIRENGCFGCHEIQGYDAAGHRIGPDMRLEPDAVSLVKEGIPGTMRKVGPSLRDIAQKLTSAMLMDRMADPRRFLPSTRMPRFFGLHNHLFSPALEQARRLEPVEIHAIAAYLLSASVPIEPLPASQGLAGDPAPARGRKVFHMQGCLACHKHEAFPDGQSIVGPDLSRMGAKYTTDASKVWLRDYLRDPAHRSPRTLMPQVPLESVTVLPDSNDGADSSPLPDPVADIMAFLLDVSPYTALAPEYRPADIDTLVLAHLEEGMPPAVAEQAVREGLSELAARELGGDAELLVGHSSLAKKLRCIGRRAIAKRGCHACHDIPGFENALPIGPELTDWGRKRESLLAFEQVERYLVEAAASAEGQDGGESGDSATDPFYMDAIRRGHRHGFLWQKLREPRSFDYGKAVEKPFNAWLTMGQFDFTAEQREAIMTFVLGLTADPPTARYVHQPDPRRRAIVKGRQVVDRHACAECHALRMERWAVAYDPREFEPPPAHDDFEWILPHFSEAEAEASRKVDDRGLAHATLAGMPRLDDDGHLATVDEDEDTQGNEIQLHAFALWEPAVLAGEVCAVGDADVLVWSNQIGKKHPAWGGNLARLLYPAALADVRTAGANPIGPEAWGWLPPPLVHTGAALRPEWLHDYLLRPFPVRPASLMRMPLYALSPEEAGKLVDFLAAIAGQPMHAAGESSPRRLRGEALTPERQERFEAAMHMLLDTQAYCAQCHRIGDYQPGRTTRTVLAPDLTQAGARLRADFLHRWLASPTSVLPYTVMPVNFPPSGKPLDPDRFPGSSVQQLELMTDLLLNYDWYLRRRQSVREEMGELRP